MLISNYKMIKPLSMFVGYPCLLLEYLSNLRFNLSIANGTVHSSQIMAAFTS